MTDIGTQSIERQNDRVLLGKDATETFLLRQMNGYQFFIP